MLLRARQFQFAFPRPAMVMGILNVTPDSFSDGGRFLDPRAAIDHAFELAEEGAEIIDVGGESTRPNAQPVSEAEELQRVMPVLEGLAVRVNDLVSIDTYKPEVARQAIRAGAAMINDIGSSRQGRAMWELAAETGAAYVAMHMQGTPQSMQRNPAYKDVRADLGVFFADRLNRLIETGVKAEQIVLDVGIGFGKTREHNLELLGGMESFGRFGRPLMLGVSRKSFLGGATGAGVQERLPAALAATCWAIACGVHIVRTHDVKATLQAIRTAEEILQRRPAGP